MGPYSCLAVDRGFKFRPGFKLPVARMSVKLARRMRLGCPVNLSRLNGHLADSFWSAGSVARARDCVARDCVAQLSALWVSALWGDGPRRLIDTRLVDEIYRRIPKVNHAPRDRVEHFSAVDRNLLGRLDAETNLVAANLDHDDRDVVVDDDALVFFSRQNEHGPIPGFRTSARPLLKLYRF